MPFDPIDLPDLPPAPHPAATKAGGMVYVSGVTAAGGDGVMRNPGNVRLQTGHVLNTIAAVLDAAGATMADVAMLHVLLHYRGDVAAFEDCVAAAFPKARPAQQVQIAEMVDPDALVEIACVAHPG